VNAANMVNGAVALVEWVGSDKHPVSLGLAEQRAVRCVACRLNRPAKGWADTVAAATARSVKAAFKIKSQLELETSRDRDLGVCSACDCPLKLKVWAPLSHILEYTSEDVLANLDSNCWILREQ
jgi:hypothetical protein